MALWWPSHINQEWENSKKKPKHAGWKDFRKSINFKFFECGMGWLLPFVGIEGKVTQSSDLCFICNVFKQYFQEKKLKGTCKISLVRYNHLRIIPKTQICNAIRKQKSTKVYLNCLHHQPQGKHSVITLEKEREKKHCQGPPTRTSECARSAWNYTVKCAAKRATRYEK